MGLGNHSSSCNRELSWAVAVAVITTLVFAGQYLGAVPKSSGSGDSKLLPIVHEEPAAGCLTT